MWIFFNKYLYCLWSLVGSPLMCRADYMHWSTAFIQGTWASADFYMVGVCVLELILCRYPGTTKFWGSQKLIHGFWTVSRVGDVQGSTLLESQFLWIRELKVLLNENLPSEAQESPVWLPHRWDSRPWPIRAPRIVSLSPNHPKCSWKAEDPVVYMLGLPPGPPRSKPLWKWGLGVLKKRPKVILMKAELTATVKVLPVTSTLAAHWNYLERLKQIWPTRSESLGVGPEDFYF